MSAGARPRVLLVQPARRIERTYPLGLASLAGELVRRGIAVAGFDFRLGGPRAFARLLARERFDLVGVGLLSTGVAEAARVVRRVRLAQPGARVVLGGPHATLEPEAALARCGADVAIRGDGELPLARLALGEAAPGAVRPGEAPGPIHLHRPLDELAHPDRAVFPIARYYGEGRFAGIRRTSLVATRGCPLRCGYCSARALGGDFAKRSIASILDEVARLRRDHGVAGLVFEDDGLLLDREFALRLLEALRRDAPGTIVDLPNGADPARLDEELLDAMRDAGVRSLALGIESLSERSLALLDRRRDPAHLERVLARARRNGIATTGYFLVGLPGDTPAAFAAQYRAIARLPLDFAHVSIFRPLPGQPLRAEPPISRRALVALRAGFYLRYCARAEVLARIVGPALRRPHRLLPLAARALRAMAG